MTERRPKVDELLFEAAPLAPAERAIYLDRACAGDAELRSEVESLLAAVSDSEGFLESPPEVTISLAQRDEEVDRTGQRLGAWLLLERLGHGGMGDVYLAERADGAFEKRVALKLVRGVLADEDLERRFLIERQALAALEHPNIARLIDGGTSNDGVPFLVMEHVEQALPIDAACRDRALSTKDRLRLFLEVCEAVQYAHGKLVVHRDIEPSNVLVDPEGRAKLLDFGIAKILGTAVGPRGSLSPTEGDLTVAGARALTPAYASPEQLAGKAVTTSTDIYSLGLLLHLLLTDGLPSDDAAPKPEGDLRFVLARALAQRPEDRYATVEQLAADIRRWLGHFPVSAAPDTWRYRASKAYHRHRVAFVVGVAVTLALVLATVLSTRSFLVAEAARVEAERERETAQQVGNFLSGVLGSINPNVAQGRDTSVLAEVIDKAAARIPEELDGQPRVAASLHATLGSAYEAIARYEEAEEQQRRRVDLRRQEGGGELASALTQLGQLVTFLSRHEEAELLLREALEVARKEGIAATTELAVALTALAENLDFQARGEEAEALLRESLDIQRSAAFHGGPASEKQLAHTLGVLGWLLATSARAPEADALLRESVEIRRRHAEEEPLQLGTALQRLAYSARVQGRYDEAQALYEEDVELIRRLVGDDSPSYGTALSHLASLHEFRGSLEQAEPLYQEAIEVQRTALGEQHREVGTSLNNLGALYRKMERWDDAKRILRQAQAVYRETLGENHFWNLFPLENLVYVHLGERNWKATEAVTDEYLSLARRHLPEEHWRVAAYESVRGACLMERGELAEAERVLQASMKRLEAGSAPALHLDRTRERLARLYQRTGD